MLMDIINIVVLILLSLVFTKQIRYIKTLVIPTKKRGVEVLSVIMGTVVIDAITYYFAKSWIHYFIGIVGTLTFISSWLKQGICSAGFIRQFRGKEFYAWNDIDRVEVVENQNIRVTFYEKLNLKIDYLCFKKESYEELMKILNTNISNVVVEDYKHNS